MTRNSLPKVDELEVSLFGPGIGECVVAHLGAGDWMIVDSCLDASGDTAIALAYLDSLGVDISRQVRLVLVTHWHDDHIRGISQVLQAAGSAKFVCSAAILHPEFFELVVAGKRLKLVEHSPGVSEFGTILEILHGRAGGRSVAGPDLWASEGMLIYQGPYGLSIHALSPSAQTITDSKGAIAKMLPSMGQPIGRFASLEPNDSSVVLLVQTCGIHVLLGADLERGIDSRRGWQAVLGSSVRPRVLSGAYKVAHHGSENADLQGIWTTLLAQDPYAILTPFARTPLPRDSDVRRMRSRTKNLYCTAWPPTEAPPQRPSVDRTMKEIARNRRAMRKTPGHIRLRIPFNASQGGMKVELYGRAKRL